MIFLPGRRGDGEVEFHRVASGDDGVIDLRRFTGRRCGGSTFAHGGYGGFRFFAAWEHLLGPVDAVLVINDRPDINGAAFGAAFIYYIFHRNNLLSFLKDKNPPAEKQTINIRKD